MLNVSNSKKYKQYRPSKKTDIFKLKDYVVFDVETTGLSYKTEKIIDIALIKVINGVISDEFTSLVNPGKLLPPRIVSLTGLTDTMLECAPSFSDIAENIQRIIGKSILIAHNAVFDASFLSEAFRQCGINCGFQYLDTVKIAKMAYPGLPNYKLETLISELNLSEKQLHRAMADTQCTLKLYRMACERLSDPLISAIEVCCYPIEDYHLKYKKDPLKGLRFALSGKFTFTYSAAKRLISAGGGTVVDLKDPNIDYLVCGITEDENPALGNRQTDEKPEQINEVRLLGLCGVTFFDDVQPEDDFNQEVV